MRSDRLTRDDVRRIQEHLTLLGFADLVLDGVWGPKTAAAYDAYLSTSTASAVVTPPASKPWWTSRALLGALATIIASVLGVAGYAVESAQITDVLVSLATLVAGVLALVGTLRRRAPIDPDLVLPGVRVRAHVQSGSTESARRDPRGHFRDDF